MKNLSAYFPVSHTASKTVAKEDALPIILDNTDDIFFLIDKNLNIIITNEQTKENVYAYFGKKITAGMCILELAPPERHPALIKLYEDVFNGAETKTQTEIKTNDSVKYFENHFKPALNRQKEIVGAFVTTKDITEYKKAEEELKKSNERFLLASRAASDAIYDWDMNTSELYWGEGIQTLFGFHPQEVIITKWKKFIHPNDRKRIITSLHQAIKNPLTEAWKEEYRFAKSDGSFRYVLDRAFLLRNEEGKAIRMIGSMKDITERKYQEQLLSLERSIFELSTHPNLKFKYIVDALLKGIEDLHPDAFTSVLVLKEDNTIDPLSSPRLPEQFSQALKGLKIGPDEGSCGAAMHRKQTVIVSDIDKHELWKNYKPLAGKFDLKACWSLPIIHSTGKVMGTFAIYYKQVKSPTQTELNTLERVRNLLRILMEHSWSLNEIKMANERFDIMMKATHDLIWDWNLETNIIYRDEAGLKKVYGVSNNKVIEGIGQWLKRVHPEDQERAKKIIDDILHTKEQNTFDIEYRFLKDDGSYSFVYDRGMIIRDGEGKPIRMIGAAQDVTERKNLEQELLKKELGHQKAINQATVDTQEQERSEIGKELHDNVNQVLTTTKLYLDLALSNPEMKDELVQKSSKNIISVINEIRQLSRSLMDPSIGDLGLMDSLNDLIESINLTRKLYIRLSTDKKIESVLTKNHKLTVFRIIQESLNNAVKHAKATTVTIDFKTRKEMIEISIQDDGIGFIPELVKKGAGLKNIQNRIYLINGSHSIQSAPGKGCKIIISFPFIHKNQTIQI